LKNNDQGASTLQRWVFQTLLMMPLAISGQVAFAADEVAPETVVSVSCPRSTFTFSKDWVKDVLKQLAHDKKISLSEQGVDRIASAYFDDTKALTVIPFSEYKDDDDLNAHLKKIAPDLEPEVTLALITDLVEATEKKENESSGRPLRKSEEVRTLNNNFDLDIAALLLKNARNVKSAYAEEDKLRYLNSLETAVKEKNYGTIERAVGLMLAPGYNVLADGYTKIFTKAQRQQFSDQAREILEKDKVALEKLKQIKKCPGLSEFLTVSYSTFRYPEGSFPLLRLIIATDS